FTVAVSVEPPAVTFGTDTTVPSSKTLQLNAPFQAGDVWHVRLDDAGGGSHGFTASGTLEEGVTQLLDATTGINSLTTYRAVRDGTATRLTITRTDGDFTLVVGIEPAASITTESRSVQVVTIPDPASATDAFSLALSGVTTPFTASGATAGDVA